MIIDKTPLQKIEDGLREFGTPISKTSIGRHKNNHMDLKPEPAKLTQSEISAAINETPDPKGTPVNTSTMEACREKAQQSDLLEAAILERRASQLMLEKIVQSQLSIVADMQERYIAGDGEYPRDPITGLKSLMDLIAKLPAYSERDIRQKNESADKKARDEREAKKTAKELNVFHDKHKAYKFGQYFGNPRDVPKTPDKVELVFPHVKQDMSAIERLEWLLAKMGYTASEGKYLDYYREKIDQAIGEWPDSLSMQSTVAHRWLSDEWEKRFPDD